MNIKNMMSILFVVLLAMSTTVFAIGQSSGDRGDATRERGGSADRGSRGEMNHDNGLQNAEGVSSSRRSSGHDIGTIGKGAPKDPNYSFNRTKQEMMNHR